MMGRLKGILAAALTVCMFALAASASSVAGSVSVAENGGHVSLYGEDGSVKYTVSVGSSYTFDVSPGQTLYLPLAEETALVSADGTSEGHTASAIDLLEPDRFRLKIDKDGEGARLVKLSQCAEKRLGGTADDEIGRGSWIKIVLNESSLTEEVDADIQLTFTAKSDDDGDGWNQGDYASLNLKFWVSNTVIPGEDAERAPGDQFVYKPVSNENNTVEWEDTATLSFSADDDASKFYAKLSTKQNRYVCETYGDPADADLFFRDFTGAPTISSSSRATLTLLNPWVKEEHSLVDPMTCRIYMLDDSGTPEDISSLFTYLDFDEDGNEVNGWRTKTRTLGCYILSDKPLDLSGHPDEKGKPQVETVNQEGTTTQEPYDPIINGNTKPIPNTGIL